MNKDKLGDLLADLDFDVLWFFQPDMNFDSRDLLELPPKYLRRIESFISNHSKEELNELEPKDFIEQATCESYDKIAKLINVQKKVKELEQDFK